MSLIASGTPSSGASSPAAGAAVGLVRLGERPLAEDDAVRVDLWLDPLDSLQVALDELAGGDLAGADQLGLAGDAREGDLGVHSGDDRMR